MSELGVNFPNRELLPDDLGRMVACGFRAFVIYVYDLRIGPAYWRERAIELRKLLPTAAIHVRLESRGPLDAKGDAAILRYLSWFFQGVADTITIRNEPNIESPGATAATWHDYVVELGELVKPATLPNAVFLPAISPGRPDAAQWIQASILGEAKFAGHWCHYYGTLDQGQAVYSHYANTRGRLICTEYNFGAGQVADLASYAASLADHVRLAAASGAESLCLFTWEWSHPDMTLPTSVNVRGTIVESYLTKGVTPMPPTPAPSPIPAAIGYPPVDRTKIFEYSQWSAARIKANQDPRDTGAFLQHLHDLGADPSRPLDYGLPYQLAVPKV